MRIIQIKGPNGSGKTTLVKDLIRQSRNLTLYEWADTYKVFATGIDDIGWIAIGEYKPDKKMGGCDGMKSIDEIKTAIQYAMGLCTSGALPLDNISYHSIVFEGAMISTIKSTFYDWLLDMDGVDPIFVMLTSSLQGCLNRIVGRGTKSVMKSSDGVASKIACIDRQIDVYDPQYIRIMDVDSIPRKDMLKTFLRLVYGG